MSIYIDSDAFIRWEKGEFDLPGWLISRGDESVLIAATVWQQLNYGTFFWIEPRAAKRSRFLKLIGEVAEIAPFTKAHAERAAELAASMRTNAIGFSDFSNSSDGSRGWRRIAHVQS